jgi:hypothetical protein
MKDFGEERVFQDISHDTVSYVLECMKVDAMVLGFRSTLDRTLRPNHAA